MDYLEDVLVAIKPILTQYGFSKKNLNWIRETDFVVLVFNIQKSQYSRRVYLNIGISINAIAQEPVTVVYKCPIQVRLDHLIGEEALDFEINLDPVTRRSRFVKLLESNPYGFFTLTGTNPELLEFIKATGTLAVTLPTREYLVIPYR
jgi:hypothetical protein